MKLPWDRKYLKISFHAILTIVGAYVLIQLLNSLGFVLTNLSFIMDWIGSGLSWVFSAFSVVLIAFIIAYLLNPLVDNIQKRWNRMKTNSVWLKRLKKRIAGSKLVRLIPKRKKKYAKKESVRVFEKRTAGAILTYILIFLALFAIGMAIYVQVVGINKRSIDEGNFTQSVSFSIDRMKYDLGEFYANLRITFEEWGVSDEVQNVVSGFIDSIMHFVQNISVRIVPIITSTGGKIVDFLMALVVAFYFLVDKDAIKFKLNELLELATNAKLYRRTMGILHEIHNVVSGYVIGQLTDASIMAVLLSVGLSIVGVDFAVLIGIFSGFSNIVPYFGAIVGFVLSVAVALISGDVTQAVYAAIVVLVLQQIDGMFIVPRIVGRKVEISPVLVLVSLSVGGSMFGFAGLLFAVPACAILKLVLSRLFDYLKAVKNESRKSAE